MINQIQVSFETEQAFTCSFKDSTPMQVAFGNIYRPPVYEGISTVSVENTAQILETKGKLLTENITINPVPEYYGKITWDGSILTVS